MRVVLIILSLLLIAFGGGCAVVLAPWISHYIRFGVGPSSLSALNVWGPIVGLIALPLLISGAASLYCLLSRSDSTSSGFCANLTKIDLMVLAALAAYSLSGIITFGSLDYIVLLIVGTFAAVIGLKILLTILCAIIVLFAGGCALTIFAGSGIGGAIFAAPLAVIPGGLAFLNVLVIGALWGKMKVRKGVFLTLVILDALVVAMSLPLVAEVGLGNTEDFLLIGLPVVLFALKGAFTFVYWRNL